MFAPDAAATAVFTAERILVMIPPGPVVTRAAWCFWVYSADALGTPSSWPAVPPRHREEAVETTADDPLISRWFMIQGL
jgi:hypothetical protein